MLFRLLMIVLSFCFFTSIASANEFAKKVCEGKLEVGWRCITVTQGYSWANLPDLADDEPYRDFVQRYNRQNTQLKTDQLLVLPPVETNWTDLSPLPEYLVFLGYEVESNDVIVFSPRELAWGHYLAGRLVAWGPAVGGKDWCPDIGRSCRTTTGIYKFIEVAGSNRRSSAYPVGCALRDSDGNIKSRSKCAKMSYFMRFTDGGQGLHARDMAGANASHGCIGLFRRDIEYLNEYVRTVVEKNQFGWLSPEQQELSPVFIVLPYE